MHASILCYNLDHTIAQESEVSEKTVLKFHFFLHLLFIKGNSNSSIVSLNDRHGYVSYSYFLI